MEAPDRPNAPRGTPPNRGALALLEKEPRQPHAQEEKAEAKSVIIGTVVGIQAPAEEGAKVGEGGDGASEGQKDGEGEENEAEMEREAVQAEEEHIELGGEGEEEEAMVMEEIDTNGGVGPQGPNSQ